MSNINLTLVLGILLLLIGGQAGYKKGLVKGITDVIALIATVLTLSLILMLTSSFKAGETRNTIFTLVIMAILGAVYSVVKFLLKSMKRISNLPIIKFADSVLGIFVGILWVFILYLVIIALGYRGYLGVFSNVVVDNVESNIILSAINRFNIFV